MAGKVRFTIESLWKQFEDIVLRGRTDVDVKSVKEVFDGAVAGCMLEVENLLASGSLEDLLATGTALMEEAHSICEKQQKRAIELALQESARGRLN